MSCSYGIRCCTYVGATAAVSKQNWASSILVSRGEAARIVVGGRSTRASAHCLGAGRNGHVDGYRALGLECSRRMVIVPGLGDIENPYLRIHRQLHLLILLLRTITGTKHRTTTLAHTVL